MFPRLNRFWFINIPLNIFEWIAHNAIVVWLMLMHKHNKILLMYMLTYCANQVKFHDFNVNDWWFSILPRVLIRGFESLYLWYLTQQGNIVLDISTEVPFCIINTRGRRRSKCSEHDSTSTWTNLITKQLLIICTAH